MKRFEAAMLGGYYLILIAFPLWVFGQSRAGLPSQIVPCTGVNCTVCDLAQLAQNIINTAVFLLIFLSALLFAYAGILMVTNAANPGQYGRAKGIFAKVTGGLIMLLAAWLIVDTLMKSVLGGSFGPWNDICRAVGL